MCLPLHEPVYLAAPEQVLKGVDLQGLVSVQVAAALVVAGHCVQLLHNYTGPKELW